MPEWTRTITNCRIKTFRSTVLLLLGTHPYPLLMQFVARVYQIPRHRHIFAKLTGFEPATSGPLSSVQTNFHPWQTRTSLLQLLTSNFIRALWPLITHLTFLCLFIFCLNVSIYDGWDKPKPDYLTNLFPIF